MATTKQTHVIAGRMVEFQDEFLKFPNEDSQYIIQNAGEAIKIWRKALANRHKKDSQPRSTVLGAVVCAMSIPATTIEFVAKDKFVVNVLGSDKVKISYLSSEFKNEFLEKVENFFPGNFIYGRELSHDSADSLIINEFNSSNWTETTLTEIYFMMERHADGETAGLLDDSRANIFYVKNCYDTLRALAVYRYGHGWRMNVYPIDARRKWEAGSRVFSRNFLAYPAS